MTTPADLKPEEVFEGLQRAVRRGARAYRLANDVPEFVDLLCPPGAHPRLSRLQRALLVEQTIRDATARLGGEQEKFLNSLLGLASASNGVNLSRRYELAGMHCGVSSRAARSDNYRRRFLEDLAAEICRIATAS